jgi:hypothetical protein
MTTNFSLTVPKPCQEDWHEFKPTEKGGFCNACQKEVIDFTSWSDEEIKEFFRNTAFTCGKFKPTQLKKYNDPNSSPFGWRLAAMLTFLSLWFGKLALTQTGQKTEYELVERKKIQLNTDTLVTQLTITGNVKDQDGVEMPGVNVIVKGTKLSTVSDGDGKFLLRIMKPKYNATLIFSFIGMINKEISVLANSSHKALDVKLEYDQAALSELIIVGGACSVKRFTPRWFWWKIRGVFSRNY